MKYEIRAETESGKPLEFDHATGPRKAAVAAKALTAKHPEAFVFVQWYRKSDGQQGYLNPDGNHSPTGKRW